MPQTSRKCRSEAVYRPRLRPFGDGSVSVSNSSSSPVSKLSKVVPSKGREPPTTRLDPKAHCHGAVEHHDLVLLCDADIAMGGLIPEEAETSREESKNGLCKARLSRIEVLSPTEMVRAGCRSRRFTQPWHPDRQYAVCSSLARLLPASRHPT